MSLLFRVVIALTISASGALLFQKAFPAPWFIFVCIAWGVFCAYAMRFGSDK